MILSHKHKFIFICNGKTGTTSIERGLAGYDESKDMNRGALGLWDGKHMPAAAAKGLLPSQMWEEYYKFAFVRNPYDWCVSIFKHNFRSRLSLRKMLRHPCLTPSWLRTHWEKRHHRAKKRLQGDDVEFLARYLRQYRALPLADTLYQSNYVNDADGQRIVNFVGKFESLHEDVRKVQDHIGISFDLPHLNATQHPHYSKFLSPAAIETVGRLWNVDFEIFGYQKENVMASE
jgi:hypothetical protein